MKQRGRVFTHFRNFIVKVFSCSTAVAWTLFALSCQPTVQATLRTELRTCPTDSPTMEQLNSLPYLEGVVRESLRLYSPVAFTVRIASHDTVIPLQKPFADNNGVLQNTVRCEGPFSNPERAAGMTDVVWRERVAKGDAVVIPIRLLNHSTEIWGEDANEFRYGSHWLSRKLCSRRYFSLLIVVGLSDGKACRRPCMGYQASMATC
jgi:cytochrome P450